MADSSPSQTDDPSPDPAAQTPNPNDLLLTPNPQHALSQPATIRIAEDLHPRLDPLRRSESESRFRPLTRSDTTALAGGIYSTRALSRATTTGTRRSISLDRRHSDGGAAFEETGDDWRAGEKPKTKQVYRGATLMWLAYQSIGAIYGDVGTSPLYVFSSTFTSDPDHDAVVQVLSLVLWSMSIMVTFKYVLIVLRADNEGEGGTFSCYSLLTRFVSFPIRTDMLVLADYWLMRPT